MKKTKFFLATLMFGLMSSLSLSGCSLLTGEVGPQGEKGEKGDKGDKGDKGEDGLPGAPGQDGKDGEDGQPGAPGAPGQNGQDGKDGEDGQPGAPGQDGKDGEDGKDGKDGEDGKSAYQIYCEAHPEYTGSEAQWLDDLVNGRLGDVEKCTVTFEVGEGTLPAGYESCIEVVKGDTLILPIPTYENHTFLGWFTGEGPNDGQFFNGQAVLSNLTLYARYSGINELKINKESSLTSKDGGLVDEIDLEGYTIDFVGRSDKENKLGSLNKFEAGGKKYNGHIYNRTIMNGLKTISVKYSGAPLYFVFTDYLLEDLSFTKTTLNRILSSKEYEAPNGYRYFMIFTDSENESEIESISIKVDKDESFYDDRLYGDKTTYASNRSTAKSVKQDDGYYELETNPKSDNNNYAHGTDAYHPNDYSWYRWNGLDLQRSEILNSNSFEIQMTIIGDFSYFVDESKLFNYHLWYDFEYFDIAENDYVDGGWVYMIIGNDNYEPMGYNDPNRVNDTHSDCFNGRFFTRYSMDDRYPDEWRFEDPDYARTKDGSTYREAYDSMSYPYWDIRFRIENEECITFINGYELNAIDVFGDGKHTSEPLRVRRTMIGGINYGNTDGSPLSSYKGSFTKPRFK